jgi:hypothetical protein
MAGLVLDSHRIYPVAVSAGNSLSTSLGQDPTQARGRPPRTVDDRAKRRRFCGARGFERQ